MHYRVRNGSDWKAASTRNIGGGGLSFRAEERLSERTEVTVSLELKPGVAIEADLSHCERRDFEGRRPHLRRGVHAHR